MGTVHRIVCAFVVAGQVWLREWEAGYWGPIVSGALGGAIGGALTLPLASLASGRAVMRGSMRRALRWGAAFFAFQAVAFYAGYFFMEVTVDALVPLAGHIGAKVPGWVLPALVCGMCAGHLAIGRQASPQNAAA